MSTTIRFCPFSLKDVERAKQELIKYKNDINDKIDLFVKKLAEKGVEIAKENVSNYNAIDTSDLFNSIDLKPGDIIKNGSTYYIYTDCEYAKYVEFGTGVIGENSPYPYEIPIDWEYASGKCIFTTIDGRTGWFYPTKDGSYRFTQGQPSRPFLSDAAMELRELVVDIAKEVFGGASDDISD